MKSLSYPIILVLMLFGCTKSDDDMVQPSWKILVTPTTNNLNDIHFSSENFGIACGDFGTLLKTIDAGVSWQNLDVGVGYSFISAFAFDENEFFTSRIALYKTTNAGVTFNEVGTTGSFGASISDIHFFNSQNGIIDKGTSVYLTRDGGNSWLTVYQYDSYADMLEVTDNNTVYLAGGITYDSLSAGELYRSIDNGNTWMVIDLPDEITRSEITAIDFLNSQVGYVSTFENKLFKTTDGGENWTKKAQFNFGPIADLHYVSENQGYLISQNKVFGTKNGGAEWIAEYQTEPTNYLTSITEAPNGTIYVSGLGGTILKRE